MDMTLARLQAKWQAENRIEARECEIAERGIQAAIEYEQELEARRENIKSYILAGLLLAIIVFGHIVI